MIRLKKRFFIFVCALGTMQGCSSITMLRTEELRAVQNHVDSLVVKLSEEQTKMVKTQKEHQELMRMIRADLQVRFDQVQMQMSALESSVSESQTRLSNIDKKTQEIRNRWDEQARADSLNQNNAAAEIEKLFQIAYGDFTAGRFDLAMAGFNDIVTRFKDNPQGIQAHYWIAECHYAKKDFENAQSGYMEHIKNYPASDKACASLYKLGLVYEKLNKAKSKTMVWQKLLEQCPESEEAAAAKNRM
jgi:tol-pal system protein YbgF